MNIRKSTLYIYITIICIIYNWKKNWSLWIQFQEQILFTFKQKKNSKAEGKKGQIGEGGREDRRVEREREAKTVREEKGERRMKREEEGEKSRKRGEKSRKREEGGLGVYHDWRWQARPQMAVDLSSSLG